MIEVNELRKSFGAVEAVRGVSFSVAAGEVFGFLGPNGAGKTTTINMLCTLAKPTGGSATVAGHDVATERDDVRRHIGLVFQDPTLDGYPSAAENLRLHAELWGPRPIGGDGRVRSARLAVVCRCAVEPRRRKRMGPTGVLDLRANNC